MDIGKHPLLKKINIVMYTIEKCGVSEELTEASIEAGYLAKELELYIDKMTKLSKFIQSLYEECPDLEKDGLGEFDGYFTSYDNFIKRISEAWDHTPCYNDDPFELIIDLINERDEAVDVANGKISKTIMGLEKLTEDIKQSVDCLLGDVQGIDNAINGILPDKSKSAL